MADVDSSHYYFGKKNKKDFVGLSGECADEILEDIHSILIRI